MSKFTRRSAFASGKGASLPKVPRKTVSVNRRPISPIIAELIRGLAENRGSDFHPGGRR